VAATFLKGLALLEAVDGGISTISDLARSLDVDKATASRLVTAAERDGWVTRDGRVIAIGPRAALLGQGSPTSLAVRAAEPLVRTIAGITGLLTQAYALIGSRAVVLVTAGWPGMSIPGGLGVSTPLWASAAGKVIAAQLEPADLARLLPPDPLPSAPGEQIPPDIVEQICAHYALLPVFSPPSSASTAARTQAELLELLAGIRTTGCYTDRDELIPGLSCHAVAWPRPGLVSALVVVGRVRDQRERGGLIHALLQAAARPDAQIADLVAAAATTGKPPPGRRL
jgi:DNA-binding IclR family transcriptional regulator